MSLNPAMSPPASLPSIGDEVTFARLGWFGLLAIELLVVLSTVGLLFVLARQSPDAVRDAWRFFDAGWMVIALVGTVSGTVAALLAWRAMAARQVLVAASCLTLTLMAGCAILAVSAIEAVGLWRYPQAIHAPQVVRIGPAASPADAMPTSAATLTPATGPDVDNGRRLYGTSCAACHGAEGQGMANIGPSLAATPWMLGHSDHEVLAFLKVGRTPGDPDSTMGRAMPARGGNMALTDNDLADIVAFMRTLEAATDANAASAPAAATPPRWLLSAPEAASVATVADEHRRPSWPHEIAGLDRERFNPADRDLAMGCLGAITALQGFHLIALMLFVAMWLSNDTSDSTPRPVTALCDITGGWMVLIAMNVAALAAWMMLA